MIWDSSLTGFGARRQSSTAVSYVLFYRTSEGRQRWYTIGRHGAPWTPDTAREEAKRLLGDVARRHDPADDKRAKRNAKTVAELCDLYLRDAESGRLLTRRHTPKKASTLTTDRGRIERHIKPLLGRRTVASVMREDVEAFMHDVAEGKTAGRTKTAKTRGLANVRGGKGTASRTVALLGAIFSYAVRHEMRTDNPAHGIVRPADGRRDRRLSDDEYKALGTALEKADATIWPPAVAVTRFLALTGWRSGEALGLRWVELDLSRRAGTLGDSKTGHSMRPLSHAACELLRGVARAGELVFPASRGEGVMTGYASLWEKIAQLGGLPADITPHVLRHSFASLAGDLGYAEPTIAALISYKRHSTTSRYVHVADAVLLAAADAVANRIAELMGERKTSGVLLEMPKRKLG
jgi:integrase